MWKDSGLGCPQGKNITQCMGINHPVNKARQETPEECQKIPRYPEFQSLFERFHLRFFRAAARFRYRKFFGICLSSCLLGFSQSSSGSIARDKPSCGGGGGSGGGERVGDRKVAFLTQDVFG